MKATLLSPLICLLLFSVLPAGALPVDTINSVVIYEREFNDVPVATVVTGENYPLSIAFVEVDVSAASGFANRDVWRFSSDSVNPFFFGNDDFFEVSMEVTLGGFPGTPRKEAGYLLDSTTGGQGQFIVNIDAHEVVAFGGPFPFYAFPATYDSGETITLGMKYFLDSATGERSMVYSADGLESPVLPFTNLEQGIIDGSTLGGYFQIVNDPANPLNSGFALFNNITIHSPDGGDTTVPDADIPTLMLLALGVLPILKPVGRQDTLG